MSHRRMEKDICAMESQALRDKSQENTDEVFNILEEETMVLRMFVKEQNVMMPVGKHFRNTVDPCS